MNIISEAQPENLMYFLTDGSGKGRYVENLFEQLTRNIFQRGLHGANCVLKDQSKYSNQDIKASHTTAELEDFLIGVALAVQSNNVEKLNMEFKDGSSYQYDVKADEGRKFETYLRVDQSNL